MLIPVTGSPLPSKVDDADYPELSIHHWKLTKLHGDKQYVYARIKKRVRFIHRVLVDAPPSMVVDHKDGDTLNNQRDNFRVCTKSQNMANSKPHKDRKGIYKGVCYDPPSGKYKAQICVLGRATTIGRFDTAMDAARAYNEAANSAFGDYARINNI